VTTFDTPDNVRTFVGNNKVFSDTIQNYTANSCRRVELTAQISGAADPRLAISRLKERIATIPNVVKSPALDVTILTFTPFVRSWPFAPTAITTITGRSISTRTWRFVKCSETPHFQDPCTRWAGTKRKQRLLHSEWQDVAGSAP